MHKIKTLDKKILSSYISTQGLKYIMKRLGKGIFFALI